MKNHFVPHAYDIEIKIPNSQNTVSLEKFQKAFDAKYNFAKSQLTKETLNEHNGNVYCSGDVHVALLTYNLPQNTIRVTLVAQRVVLEEFCKVIVELFGQINYSIPTIVVLNIDLDKNLEPLFIAKPAKYATAVNLRVNVSYNGEKYDMMFLKNNANNRLYLNIENNSHPIWHSTNLDVNQIKSYTDKVTHIVNEYINDLIGE